MPVDTAVQRLEKRRTKIVATVGPASREPGTLEALVRAGVEVFRLNFSHGTHDEHGESFRRVRDVCARLGAPVAVLADLCGPKIRAGTFRGGSIVLTTGEQVRVTVREVTGEAGLIPSAYAGLAGDVAPGSRILLDDGNIELVVETVEGTEVRCAVAAGGVLRDRKGINLPGVAVSAPSLTEKDREDALFALEMGADLLALSFVRRAEDVADLQDLVAQSGSGAGIIAKIEKPEALDEIDSILAVSDGIMVARGDLGVELPPELVPIVQAQLVDLARIRGKPVIVATQMLESMIGNARPTRAEVTDVSNAVRSGADAVMLSAETAVGAHAVGAVGVMDRVARETEGYLWRRGAFGSMGGGIWAAGGAGGGTPGGPSGGGHPDQPLDVREAVSRATSQLSRDLMVRAIVVFTRSGWSAGMVASSRPQAPVLAVSGDPRTCRRMNLLWGVVPVCHPFGDSADELHELARSLARESGLAGPGDIVLRVWGFHSEAELNVPTVSVLAV
jgi:pyruvate kinase